MTRSAQTNNSKNSTHRVRLWLVLLHAVVVFFKLHRCFGCCRAAGKPMFLNVCCATGSLSSRGPAENLQPIEFWGSGPPLVSPGPTKTGGEKTTKLAIQKPSGTQEAPASRFKTRGSASQGPSLEACTSTLT